MKCASATLLLLAVAGGISADGNRHARASAGAYSGVSNGQFYGGTYHTPDGGPTVFNRFGDEPQGPSGHGDGGYAPQFGFGPGAGNPPFQNPFEFNEFFQSYFKVLNNNLAAAFEKNQAYQRAAFEAAQNAFQTASSNRFGSSDFVYQDGQGSGNNGGSGNYGGNNGGAASASASFGPSGGHQSANIYPENPASPNINNRFGSPGTKPGGNYGVSTSSFSSSSDVNGKKSTHKQASTSINDNGKVTTFVVRD